MPITFNGPTPFPVAQSYYPRGEMPLDRRCHRKTGFNHVLQRNFRVEVPELGGFEPFNLDDMIQLFVNLNGVMTLYIDEGYAWDGASGPTIDSRCFTNGPLAHDALYQAGREGLLPMQARDGCDRIMQRLILEDIQYFWRSPEYTGRWWGWTRIKQVSDAAASKFTRAALIARAEYWYQGVKMRGSKAFTAAALKQVQIFP